MRGWIIGVWVLGVLAAASGRPSADTYAILIDENAVSTPAFADSIEGTCVLLDLTLPAAMVGRTIHRAVLELRLDVAPRGAAVVSTESVLIGLCMVPPGAGGTVARASLDCSWPMAVNVPMGENRRVRLDVTDWVKEQLAASKTSAQLALGTVRGASLGEFSIRSGAWAPGSQARLVFLFE